MRPTLNKFGGYAPVHRFRFVLGDGLRLTVIAWLAGMADGKPDIRWQRVGPRDDRVEALIREPTESLARALDLANQVIDDVMGAEADVVFTVVPKVEKTPRFSWRK
ncbi:MAG: hypothetical protein HYV75_08625 [Opitutae bacterium]|nr:hypothetical protein [Opitutae bacterium]